MSYIKNIKFINSLVNDGILDKDVDSYKPSNKFFEVLEAVEKVSPKATKKQILLMAIAFFYGEEGLYPKKLIKATLVINRFWGKELK